jgi:hypothetical protein
MAYGDATPTEAATPWDHFEFVDYIHRMEDLFREWGESASRDAQSPIMGEGKRTGRKRKEIEECAIEFAAYCVRTGQETEEPRC